jgi:hypothetical protein
LRIVKAGAGSRRHAADRALPLHGIVRRRRGNAYKIEELEVLYPRHPWFGRVVYIHEMINSEPATPFAAVRMAGESRALA